jgi:periplasmic protein TonB
MTTHIHNGSNFSIPAGILAAVILTVLFFVAQPILTELSVTKTGDRKYKPVVISQRKPPPPPEEDDMDEKVEQKSKTPEAVRTAQAVRTSAPKIDMAAAGFGGGGLGGQIEIGSTLKKEFTISNSLFVSAFKISEVDQPPRTLRATPPRYPFEAKQKGITGKVVLRFVVDTNGNAKEPQIVSAEPKGIFENAALEAVVNYKFRPAMKGGKAVDCICKLPIAFDLNE